MKRAVQILLALVGALALCIGAFVAYTFANEHRPAPVEPVPTACTAGAPLQRGKTFKILSWNLQYGASRKHQFFYDGGEAVHVPPADVAETMAAITGVIRTESPDIGLIQEIDRDSTRTARKDQLPPLVEALSANCTSTTPYHLANFVPKPFTNPLGRVHMALAILTRPLHANASRTALALLDEPRLFQALNLKRALLTAEIPVEGLEKPLAVAVTHLSAFSFGDGTHPKQVEALAAWMASHPPDQPWILAGDMNLLPPGDDRNRLTTERELYADEPNPINQLIPRFTEVFSDQLSPANRTYLPFGAAEPDRKIDYIFYGGPLEIRSAQVLREHSAISDHLPIRLEMVIPLPPEPAPPALPEETPAIQ